MRFYADTWFVHFSMRSYAQQEFRIGCARQIAVRGRTILQARHTFGDVTTRDLQYAEHHVRRINGFDPKQGRQDVTAQQNGKRSGERYQAEDTSGSSQIRATL